MDRATNAHSGGRSKAQRALHLGNCHLQKQQPGRLTGLTGELQQLLILKVKRNLVKVQWEDGDFHVCCTALPTH